MTISKIKYKLLLSALLLPSAAMAQSGEHSSNFNPVLLGFLSLMFLLALAIALLGSTLQNLMRVYRGQLREKRKAGNANIIKTLVLMLGFSLLAFGANAQEAAAAGGEEAAEEVAAYVSPYISGILRTDFYVLMGVIALEVAVMLILLYYVRKFIRLVSGQPAASLVRGKRMRSFLDRFNSSVSVEKEETIVLEHEYDGIRELDNSLPPWWKWGFVMTIIFSVVYMWYYHVGSGPSSHEEYIAAVEKAEMKKAAFLAKSGNVIDENTITMLQDPAELEKGKTLFTNTCAACHAADGGGSVGPNLTDDYWLHGGSLSDVFKSIKYGIPDKGMPAWQANMSPQQLAQLTSYVKSLHGSTPAVAKAPQGDLFVEGGDAALDSVSTATEPSLTPQPENQ